MEQLRFVDKAGECRRPGGNLGHVVNLQALALVRRRLHPRGGVAEHVVEHAGGDAAGVLLVHFLDHLVQVAHPLAGHGGDKDHRRIGHKAEVVFQLFLHLLHRLVGLVLHRVPLVDRDDAGLALLVGVARNLGILFAEAAGGVDHDDADIGAIDGHVGAQHAVALDGLLHLALAADAGGIDKDKFAVLVFHHRVGRVAGGAGDVRDDDRLPARNAVDQRGFARVWPSDDGDGDAVVVVPVLLREVQMLIHRVQQVAGAVSVHRGDRDRVAQSQIIKLIEFRRNLADAVALVDAQHHRLVALLQHGGNLLVGRGDAGLDVYHQDDDLRALDGHLGLTAHLREDDVVRIRLDAAGIDQHDLVAAPLAGRIDAVAGDAGSVLHNREPLADQFIKQGGFADIRPAHHCDDWSDCHR